VTSLAAGWAAQDYVPVRLTPGRGRYEAQRRCAACRAGMRGKGRRFWVHAEKLEVYHVGAGKALFSTTQPVAARQPVKAQIGAADERGEAPLGETIELHDLRCHISISQP
jgi:hypothetical protein